MKIVELTEVCDFQGGTQPPKSEWSVEKKAGYIRMLQIRDFTQGKIEHISFVKDTRRLKKCEESDVLIGRYGASVGKILSGLKGAYNVALIKTIPDADILSKKFLYYVLIGKEFQNFIKSIGNRAAQAGFNKSDLRGFRFTLPDLSTQRQIVTVLDKAKALVDKRQQSIDLLDELLSATFLDIFGDVVSVNLNRDFRPLKELIKIKHGYAFKSQFFKTSGEYKLLTPGNFDEKGGFKELGAKQKFYVGEFPEKFRLKKGDLLLAMTEQTKGLLGSPLIVPDNDCLHNQRLGLVEFDIDRVNPTFLFYFFNSLKVKEIIHFQGTGVKVRHTSPTKIESLGIKLPSKTVQDEFSEIAKNKENQIIRMLTSAAELGQLFQSLLQRAFHGDLVVDAELQLEGLLEARDYRGIAKDETLVQKLVDKLNQLKDLGITPHTHEENEYFDGFDQYETIREFVFRLLKEGKIAQVFDELEEQTRLEIV